MDTQVEERLARLGQGIEHVPAPIGEVVWMRGRRRLIARRAAAAVAAVAVVAVGGSMGAVESGLTRTDAVPVSADTPTVLPDKLAWALPEALPDLGKGEVSAVGVRQRTTGRLWWSDVTPEVVGIQTTTGAYGVIETTDLISEGVEGLSLSPDGGTLAYWAGDDPASRSADGIVVQDLVSGRTIDHDLGLRFGAAAEDDALTWLDSERLLVTPMVHLDDDRSRAQAQVETSFVLGRDGTVEELSASELHWPISNAVAGQHLSQTFDEDTDVEGEPFLVDPVSGSTEEVVLPDLGATSGRYSWNGKQTVATLLDSTPNVTGDNDVEVAYTTFWDCPDTGNCLPPVWRPTGVNVPDWSSWAGWRGGSAVINTRSGLDEITAEGRTTSLITFGPANGVVDSGEWGRGGAVQRWVFASDVIAEGDVVAATEPGTDPARWVLRTAPFALLALAGLAGVAVLVAAGLRQGRSSRGAS